VARFGRRIESAKPVELTSWIELSFDHERHALERDPEVRTRALTRTSSMSAALASSASASLIFASDSRLRTVPIGTPRIRRDFVV